MNDIDGRPAAALQQRCAEQSAARRMTSPQWSRTYRCIVVPASYVREQGKPCEDYFHLTEPQVRALAEQLSHGTVAVCGGHDLEFAGGRVARAWVDSNATLWAEFQLDLNTFAGSKLASAIGAKEMVCVSLGHELYAPHDGTAPVRACHTDARFVHWRE